MVLLDLRAYKVAVKLIDSVQLDVKVSERTYRPPIFIAVSGSSLLLTLDNRAHFRWALRLLVAVSMIFALFDMGLIERPEQLSRWQIVITCDLMWQHTRKKFLNDLAAESFDPATIRRSIRTEASVKEMSSIFGIRKEFHRREIQLLLFG